MTLVQNFPFISIILALFSGPLSSILDEKKAKWWNLIMITLVGGMSGAVLSFVLGTGQEYVYTMGHFPAPWGNEIRIGVLEAFMALFFCIIMFLCMVGGVLEREAQIVHQRFIYGICLRGDQYDLRLRTDHDPAEWADH